MRKRHYICALSVISLACAAHVFAAKPIDLNHQSTAILHSFLANGSTLKQVSADVDFNQTTHVRIQQTYLGYPIWGGDAILHIAKTTQGSLKNSLADNKYDSTMNGMLYQDLQADLGSVPIFAVHAGQATAALQQAVALFQKKSGIKQDVNHTKTDLIVFVDQDNKAHWAYWVSFLVAPKNSMPAKPVYILDATHFTVYEEWNDIQTLDDSVGGGFGGNIKMGKAVYDGLASDLPALNIERDTSAQLCYLENADVIVKDVRKSDAIVSFKCDVTDSQHNNEYWDGDQDAVNGGYSPSNDALFAGKVIKNMYQEWYGLPVLTKNGKPMILSMRVHENMDNAYWDGQQMTFGDGIRVFYPLVSLGVAAHEISHGFTQQHSNLQYYGQSGGLNEAFSDMAAQAAEFYAYQHNSWQIGPEIFKQKDRALRYMDKPSRDCNGGAPGNWCSIDTVQQYHDGLDVHYSSGVFNRMFYVMGTAEGWDARKAFDVMVQANRYYWTPTISFMNAACGVLKATRDYQYDEESVKNAIQAVGMDASKCE